MDSASRSTMSLDAYSLNRRISAYKECCFRAYGFGLAALSIVSSVSYFCFERLPIRRKFSILAAGCLGSVAGYKVSEAYSKECNAILKAHRESMRNPVSPDPGE